MYAKNVWKDSTPEKNNLIMAFCEDYKEFISIGKTERLCVDESIKIAKKYGYVELNDVKILKDVVNPWIKRNCAFFVKASNGIGLSRFVADLEKNAKELK